MTLSANELKRELKAASEAGLHVIQNVKVRNISRGEIAIPIPARVRDEFSDFWKPGKVQLVVLRRENEVFVNIWPADTFVDSRAIGDIFTTLNRLTRNNNALKDLLAVQSEQLAKVASQSRKAKGRRASKPTKGRPPNRLDTPVALGLSGHAGGPHAHEDLGPGARRLRQQVGGNSARSRAAEI